MKLQASRPISPKNSQSQTSSPTKNRLAISRLGNSSRPTDYRPILCPTSFRYRFVAPFPINRICSVGLGAAVAIVVHYMAHRALAYLISARLQNTPARMLPTRRGHLRDLRLLTCSIRGVFMIGRQKLIIALREVSAKIPW
jgi:hypothetical protein